MTDNIGRDVFDVLDTRSKEIGKELEKYNQMQEDLNSGKYSNDYKNELFLKSRELKTKIDTAGHAAIAEALELIDQYLADVEDLDRIDPAQLTDDVKLLQPGIILRPNDIDGMLKRNAGNRTMTQLILRYADEHNINIDRKQYHSGQQERQNADGLREILHYYEKWIATEHSQRMLLRFFGIK